jgi:hypothetical protein
MIPENEASARQLVDLACEGMSTVSCGLVDLARQRAILARDVCRAQRIGGIDDPVATKGSRRCRACGLLLPRGGREQRRLP